MEHDTEMTEFKARLTRFRVLSPEQRLELAGELLRRDSKARRDLGLELLRTKFPAASDDILGSAAHHVYLELPDAARDMLAWLELGLRERNHEQHSGIHSELLYHLYNWLQLEALIPYGRRDVFEDLQEIGDCLRNDDKEGAIGILDSLKERFDATKNPPAVDA